MHPSMPEWGAGVVRAVVAHSHGGKHGQRLTIRFDGVGTKVISTTLINLKPAGTPPSETAEPSLTHENAESRRAPDSPAQLPPEFTSRRLAPADVLHLAAPWYRFEPNGRSLLDWGIARMSMDDPLRVITREQLTEAFCGFFRRLDFLVVEAAKDLRRRAPQEFSAAIRDAPPRMRALLALDAKR